MKFVHLPRSRVSIDNHSFILIPKCASTSIEQAMIRNKAIYSAELPDENEKFFTVIRDPFDRWITGVHQYIKDNISGQYDLFMETMRIIKDGNIIFDEHTLPMTYFLYPFRAYHIKYIHMNKDMITNINEWSRMDLTDEPMNQSIHNNKVDDGVRYIIQSIAQTDRFLKRFEHVYRDDIKFFHEGKLEFTEKYDNDLVAYNIETQGFKYA